MPLQCPVVFAGADPFRGAEMSIKDDGIFCGMLNVDTMGISWDIHGYPIFNP